MKSFIVVLVVCCQLVFGQLNFQDPDKDTSIPSSPPGKPIVAGQSDSSKDDKPVDPSAGFPHPGDLGSASEPQPSFIRPAFPAPAKEESDDDEAPATEKPPVRGPVLETLERRRRASPESHGDPAPESATPDSDKDVRVGAVTHRAPIHKDDTKLPVHPSNPLHKNRDEEEDEEE